MITIKRASSGAGSSVKTNFAATVNPTVTDDAVAGYAAGSVWFRIDSGEVWRCRSASAGAAVWIKTDTADFDAFVANNWYLPFGIPPVGTGAAMTQNTVRLHYGIIKERVTIDLLGIRLTSTIAGNMQIGVYRNLNGRPTGNVIDKTASISTAVATSVNAAPSGATIQLEPGGYWFGTMFDTASNVAAVISTACSQQAQVSGSATQSDVNGTAGMTGVTTGVTFGTWPDLTAVNCTVTMGATIPAVQFRAKSVP